MAVRKFNGKGLSLMLATTEFNEHVTAVNFTNEAADDDVQTFADLAAGGSVVWSMEIEGIGDYTAGSLWDYLWKNAGSNVAFTVKPYGNASASTTQPHFTGTLSLGPKPSIGGTSGETWTFEYTCELVGEPTLKTAP